MKIDSDCYSNFSQVPAGVPQGTKLGLLAMIIDLPPSSESSEDMRKHADDTTISEIIPKHIISVLQSYVEKIVDWSKQNKLR